MYITNNKNLLNKMQKKISNKPTKKANYRLFHQEKCKTEGKLVIF